MSDTLASPTCDYHPERSTLLSCSRCERSVCPDCIVHAAVGMVCLGCLDAQVASETTRPPIRTRTKKVPQLRSARRARTDDEALRRPGIVFAGIVATFVVLCVIAGLMTYTGEMTGVQHLVGFLLIAAGWIVSLCFHEYAHAAVAYYWGGDHDVPDKGYLKLDPRKYSDPVTSVIMPIAFLILGGIGLPGGAVWINRDRVRSRKVLTAIALAGPATNVIFALLILLVVKTGVFDGAPILASALAFLGALEIATAILNLLPIPGVDGYHAIEPYLPRHIQETIRPVEPIMYVVLLFLMFSTHALDFIWDITYWGTDRLGIDPFHLLLGYDLLDLPFLHPDRG